MEMFGNQKIQFIPGDANRKSMEKQIKDFMRETSQ